MKKHGALSGGEAEKIEARNGMLVIVRQKDGERITGYFNTSGAARGLEADGEILVEINYGGGRLSDGGALVVKENI